MQEIDVNCGVFALLKDCNQDIVWIGTDGSGLLRQAVGEVAIRSVTYETLPYLLTKPIKALHVDPEGDLWIGTKNDGILRIRDFYSRRTFTRENTDSYTAADSPLGKNSVYTFAGSRRNVLWIGGDGGVCYYSYRHRRIFELPRSGALRRIHGLYTVTEQDLVEGRRHEDADAAKLHDRHLYKGLVRAIARHIQLL